MTNIEKLRKFNESLLDFVVDYGGCVKMRQLRILFPKNNTDRAVRYLLKNKRLFDLGDGYISHRPDYKPRKPELAALEVLCDLISAVDHHTPSEYPAIISFVSTKGDFYEIVYVKQGGEASIQADYNVKAKKNALLPAHLRQSPSKLIIVLESEDQIESAKELEIPGIVRFAVMGSDGKMIHFKKE